MLPPHTFVVIPAKNEGEYVAFVREEVVPAARSSVHILTDVSKKKYHTDVASNVTMDLIASLSAQVSQADQLLFIHHETKCNAKKLSAWWKSAGQNASKFRHLAPISLKKELKGHWEVVGIQWRLFANNQLKRFDGHTTPLDNWLHQFGNLNVAPIGKKLSTQLRVIRIGELSGKPLSLRPTEQFGLHQIYGYFKDDDEGGSWVSIQDELTKSHPVGSVHSVKWEKDPARILFPEVMCDEIVLYEDGLWSGTETVRRLKAISNCPPAAQIRLKFGVVTDFGLLITRHAIRKLGLANKVTVDASSSELIRFLRNDLPDELKLGKDLSSHDYFQMLHKYTVPHGFGEEGEWSTDEIEACEQIGAQLVGPWLKRETGRPAKPERIARFALGGGRFASTTLFARSRAIAESW